MRRLFFSSVLITSIIINGCSGTAGESKNTSVELPGESIYALDAEWHNQYGDTLLLKDLRGKIPVVAMIFTRCEFACPRIISDIKKIEKQVPEDKKQKVVFVLVSFDSERDNPQSLRKFASEMQLDEDWLLLHGDESAVRELSMLLSVKYRKQPDGSFTHSNDLTLLDQEGVISGQVHGLGINSDALVEKIKVL